MSNKKSQTTKRRSKVIRPLLTRTALARLRERVEELNRERSPLEEMLQSDGFEKALVGLGESCGNPEVLVYSTAKTVEILMKRDGMKRDEAIEHFDFNIGGACMGVGTPYFLDDL